ncbi:GspE/PulE family protein [Fundidesulfovibrio terrae]|uniref:GspE/PulE family protein n=1 Tax=Fundidesulfovibrio terrae TaxID=2922866 RepID=UPI001FAE7831|nr:GspE/PulE family protein [Fundidesulfovibrio terrae]
MKALHEKLVDSGLVTKSEVDQVRQIQRKSGWKIVEYLMHQGRLNENELIDFISRELKIDKYTAEKYPLDKTLKEVLPEDLARKLDLVPVKLDRNVLYVVTADPESINRLDQVERVALLEVEPVFCTKAELEELMAGQYGVQSHLGDMLGIIDELTVQSGDEADEGMDLAGALQSAVQEAPVVRLVNQILAQAVRERASDIHLSPMAATIQMRFRIDGELREFPTPPKSVFLTVLSRLKLLANMDITITRIPQDGRFSFVLDGKEVNVRASTLPTIHGENLVLRLLTRSSRGGSMDELGVSEEDRRKLQKGMDRPFGMILATGPTGSGKTTLLYAALRQMDQPGVNIITLEDPVEYRIETIRQVQLNVRAGMTFASGLRAILRQDPDVIMVGEIRDGETAQIAVQSALTGHQVLSTVHTNSACQALTRLSEMGIEPFLIASTLAVVVGQRLVRRICPKCKEPYQPPKELLDVFEMRHLKDVVFMRGKGCPDCNGLGYAGRVGVYEVLYVDDLVQDLILRKASAREIEQAAVEAGAFSTLKMDALSKVVAGFTTIEEAATIAFM